MNQHIVEIFFTKMTGAGNDFVMIDNRSEKLSLDWSKAATVLCNRHYGIGADGLIVIERSSNADFRMNYFNADGSYGGMCGNGGRCSAMFMFDSLIKPEVEFEALDYIYSARKSGDNVSLSMKNPTDLQIGKEIEIEGNTVKYHYVNTGSPHVVIYESELPELFQEEIHQKGIERLGRLIRNHQAFQSDGTNVNFVSLLKNYERDSSPAEAGFGMTNQQKQQPIKMRTYERGVEAETLACGTGSVACAVITNVVNGYSSPIQVQTQSNETLIVGFNKDGNRFIDIELTGSAKVVFSGSIKYDSQHHKICS
ncbi:MAG: diaminopimelate epimerase [Ignavibacteriae bacterium]|nr:diaminopimelate epimerase [Ignavibacteriota bacterium]